jgi:hypothetical protein
MKLGERANKEKRELGDQFDNMEPPPSPVMGPDGPAMPVTYLTPGEPLPPATPENFLCLLGPCKHYVEIHSWADVEARGIQRPKQINRICRVIPGVDLDLTEDCVFACNEWAPILPDEIAEREHRRNVFRRALAARKAQGAKENGK